MIKTLVLGKKIPKNTFFKAGNKLYYFDSNGDFGRMTIDGKDYCVYSWGEVIRGGLGPYNTLPYYDEETGAAIPQNRSHKIRQ